MEFFLLSQGSYQMFASIQTSNDSKIDQVVFNWILSPSLEWTPTQIGTTQNDVVTLEARARVFCGTNFYGPTCRDFCVERDDSFGHYTCDPNGGIICREGYTDTTSNCVTRESTTQTEYSFHLHNPKTGHIMHRVCCEIRGRTFDLFGKGGTYL